MLVPTKSLRGQRGLALSGPQLRARVVPPRSAGKRRLPPRSSQNPSSTFSVASMMSRRPPRPLRTTKTRPCLRWAVVMVSNVQN